MILVYLGHPAHYHLFKHLIRHHTNNVAVVIKTKDVLENLLREEGIPFIKIEELSNRSNTGSKIALMLRILKRVGKMLSIIKEKKPRLLLGSAAELALSGKLTGIPTYVFFEDDVEKVHPYGWMVGPLATGMVCPEVCSAGRWTYKKTGYASYHELAYLHPAHFTPDRSVVKDIFSDAERNFVIRFVDLIAFHDKGKKGITDALAQQLIDRLLPFGRVHISSERKLPAQFEPYRLKIPTSKMHDVLAFADLFIGDSQTMTAEAAVLGTPALRFNDFVGELSYLEELEHTYGLTYGFRTDMSEGLLGKLDELLRVPDLKIEWRKRKEKMLTEKIDLAQWMIGFVDDKIRIR